MAVEQLETRKLLCGLPHSTSALVSDIAPQYQPTMTDDGPEVDTGGIVWSNRGSDNFAVYGAKADAARQVVDAAFYFWNQVIGSFNQDGGNSQVDITVMALAAGTGQGGNGGVDTLLGNKPRTSQINLGGGSDRNMNGTIEDAEGFYVDPTPYDYSEFQGEIVNAFTGTATPLGPAEGQWDLFSLVTIEIQHALGVEDRYTNLAWRQDPNDYLKPTTTADLLDNPGFLWTFNSPNLKALFTSNNGGSGGQDKSYAIHTGRVSNSVVVNGITYNGQDDTGTTGGFGNKRYLPSYVGVQALADIYGYIVNPPQDVIGSFYAVPDRANRQVRVRNTNNASNDVMEMRSSSGGIFITLNIGADVPGTNLDGLFVVQFSRLAFDSAILDGGGGNDILRVDGNDGAPVTLRGSAGVDTFDVALQQRRLDQITGTVVIDGGFGSDSILLFNNNDTTGDGTNFTSNAFDTTGFNFMSYSGVEAITYTAGTGHDNITVQSMSTPLTIHGNSGNDIITLGTGPFDANTITAPIAVTGGLGSDRLNIGSGNADAVAAPVTWDGSGSGTDSLVYNDTSPTYAVNYDISPTGVNRDGINQPFLVAYQNTQSITINGGAGSDTIFVRNGVGPSLFAFGNDGNDNFIRGDGNVTATSGAVFNGGNGNDRITFDDHLRPGNLIWDIRNNEVIYGGLILFETTGFESVGILAGNGNDEITFTGSGSQSLSQSFDIDAGGGNDTIIIGFQGAARFFAPVTVNGGAGNDTYTWRNNSDNWYFTLFGTSIYPVLLDGGSGYNVLNMDESARTGASLEFYQDRIVTVEPAGFPFGADINYDNMQAIGFTASNSANAVSIFGVSSDIDIGNQVTINMNGGNDLVSVYPRNAAGDLTINGNIGIFGGGGSDNLRVQDATSNASINYAFSNPSGPVTQNLFGMGTGALGTATIETWEVYGGNGDDTFAMNQFTSGIALGINGGGGNDTLQFGNNGLAAITSIAYFAFDGAAGSDTFNLNNQTQAATWIYTRNLGSIAASSTSGASYFLLDFNIELMRLNGGPSPETFNINAVAAGSAVEANGAGGIDLLQLTPSSSTAILIQGPVSFNAGADGGRAIVYDGADTAGEILHLDQVSLGAYLGDNLFGTGGSFRFAGLTDLNIDAPALTIHLGSGADTAYVQPLATGQVLINANLPPLAPISDRLRLATAALTSPIVNGNAAAGNLTSANRPTLSWTGFEAAISTDAIAPAVVAADINLDGVPGFVDGGGVTQAVVVQFSENVSGLLSAASLQLTNLTLGQVIPTANIAVQYEIATNTARFTFPGYVNGTLPDGNYQGKILAGLPDFFGNGLPADANFSFFFLNGDANHDRRVDIGDFSILAARFNLAGTFSQGDFDYNGNTDIGDFAILANKFNTSLPAARPAISIADGTQLSAVPAVESRTLFAVNRIGDSVLQDGKLIS